MLKKTVSLAVLVAFSALLMGACSAKETAQKTLAKIDAHTLLEELQKLVEEIPDTKEGCQALLQEIRDWQERRSRELKSQPKPPKYGFENQYQWEPEKSDPYSVACTQVFFSSERHFEDGSCSLKMMMDLAGGDPNRSKGEAWVNMRRYPPVGEHIPVNLRDRTVTAWIYAPWGARGASNKPNGLQVFVRDANTPSPNSQYGPWQNVREAEWFKISLPVKSYDPNDTERHTDPGFDPTRIEVIGVKMAAGDGSKEKYNGPVFVDEVDW